MDVGQAALDAVVVEGELLVVDAEQVQDGGVKVVPRDRAFDSFPASTSLSTRQLEYPL